MSKCPRDQTSQGTKCPEEQNVLREKCPEGQNVLQEKCPEGQNLTGRKHPSEKVLRQKCPSEIFKKYILHIIIVLMKKNQYNTAENLQKICFYCCTWENR
jgi:hypothetical protein